MMVSERPIIDLNYCHSKWTFGDFTVSLTWTMDDRRPCMVILPTRGPLQDCIPGVIRMDEAYKWSDTIVGDPIHQERWAGAFSAGVGFDPMNHGTRRRIITAIQNRLQDLLTMPPLDTNGDVAEVADLKLTDLESGKVIEIEAKTDV